MNKEKPTNIVIKEMKSLRNVYMKNSTPWRQLNRVIKKLRKLEKIEQILDRTKEINDYPLNEIREVLEQNN